MDKDKSARIKTANMRERRHVPKQSEHDLQKACVNWFRYQYPGTIIYAIPNGGQRNVIVAQKLKSEGVLSGIPDLCIPAARKGYHGLYIEMKSGRNTTTENQNEVMDKLRKEGYLCEVCWSFVEFVGVVTNYFNKEKLKQIQVNTSKYK